MVSDKVATREDRMTFWNISLDTANEFYTWGWRASMFGALITFFGVAFLYWGTRVRDHDFDSKMTTLNSEAGNARERAGRLEEKAQELEKGNLTLQSEVERERIERMKLELKLSPRSLGPAKQAQLTSALRPILTGIAVDLVVFEALGPDVGPLGREIAKALTDAGIVVRVLTPLPGGMFATGVLVRAEAESPANIMGAVPATANALRQVGLDAGAWEPFPKGEMPAPAYNGPGGPNSNFRILIGAKP
jgi:hypothetical protein